MPIIGSQPHLSGLPQRSAFSRFTGLSHGQAHTECLELPGSHHDLLVKDSLTLPIDSIPGQNGKRQQEYQQCIEQKVAFLHDIAWFAVAIPSIIATAIVFPILPGFAALPVIIGFEVLWKKTGMQKRLTERFNKHLHSN